MRDQSGCIDIADHSDISLAQLIDRALCANPDTQAAWQRRQTQVAQVGIAQSAWYPTLNANSSQIHNLPERLPGTSVNQQQLSLNSTWLLWDFGARSANIRKTKDTLAALQLSYDARSQVIAFNAVQAYFTRLAAEASAEAAHASVQAARETAQAALQRVKLGAGTREEELQAATALAQAQLALIQRQGELASAAGQLAVVAGYPANRHLDLLHLRPDPANAPKPPDLDQFILQAQQQRPDRLAQLRSVDAAESELDRIAAQARPSLNFSANTGRNFSSYGSFDNGQLALTATLPLFTGFLQRNQELAARSQINQQRIELARIEQQLSLDVWLAWQQLNTASARISATDSLLSSATQSNQAALARYKAGLGSLLNVLNAQSSLADARQQQARAGYDWSSARLQLAQAGGLLVRDADSPLNAAQEQRP